MNFNASDFASNSSSSVSAKLNLSSLVLTGPMSSLGISNSVQPITSSENLSLTGNAKFSQQFGAQINYVLTCDGSGVGTWKPGQSGYDVATDTTTLQGTTKTTGIENRTNGIYSEEDITISSANLIFETSGAIKYPAGANLAGKFLQSDANGLLSLQSLPFIPTTFVNAVFTTGNTVSGNPNTVFTGSGYNIGTITLPAGTWEVYYKYAYVSTGSSVSLTGQSISSITNLSGSTSNFFHVVTVSASVVYCFQPHQFIVTTTSTATYNLNLKFQIGGGGTTALGSTAGPSVCYAKKLS